MKIKVWKALEHEYCTLHESYLVMYFSYASDKKLNAWRSALQAKLAEHSLKVHKTFVTRANVLRFGFGLPGLSSGRVLAVCIERGSLNALEELIKADSFKVLDSVKLFTFLGVGFSSKGKLYFVSRSSLLNSQGILKMGIVEEEFSINSSKVLTAPFVTPLTRFFGNILSLFVNAGQKFKEK